MYIIVDFSGPVTYRKIPREFPGSPPQACGMFCSKYVRFIYVMLYMYVIICVANCSHKLGIVGRPVLLASVT